MTFMQKVLHPELVDRYLNNDMTGGFDPAKVGGFVYDFAYLVDVPNTPAALKEANGLAYEGGPIPEDDSVAYIIRFQPQDFTKIRVPISDKILDLAGKAPTPSQVPFNYRYPYTGTGFTSSKQHLIREYVLDARRAVLRPGAQIWKIDPDGNEQILGKLDYKLRWVIL